LEDREGDGRGDWNGLRNVTNGGERSGSVCHFSRKTCREENLGDLSVDGWIILKLFLKKCVGLWTGFISLRMESIWGLFVHGNETLAFIKAGRVGQLVMTVMIRNKDTFQWRYSV
jgi:hypothetical protein